MRLCAKCKEPAVKDVLAGSESLRSTGLCYLHAAESGLLGISLDDVRSAAEECGYSVNALLFVSEALARAGECQSAVEVSRAVLQTAKRRFGRAGSRVLSSWNIIKRRDIGAILGALNVVGIVDTQGELKPRDFDRSFTVQDILDDFGDL